MHQIRPGVLSVEVQTVHLIGKLENEIRFFYTDTHVAESPNIRMLETETTQLKALIFLGQISIISGQFPRLVG